MNSLHDVWRARFTHYMGEVQKYLRFVFTGHLAIVIMFVLGAAGYKYSEWLKTASSDFPSILLATVILGIVLGISRPITLIRKPDMGLSPLLVSEIFHIIREINDKGTTILLVEQNAKRALAIADRAYVLETGNITLEGTGEELANDERVQKAYLGG